MSKIGGYVKNMIRGWLNVKEASATSYTIDEKLNYDSTAIRNRIWYRGDPLELSQLYRQIGKQDASFWSMVPESVEDVRKIHSGLPALIVDTLASIVIRDMGDIKIDNRQEEWDLIASDNDFENLISKVITECLSIGDGAIKFSVDKSISDYPIIEFYSGDEVDFVYERGRYRETIFKNVHIHNDKVYIHYEHYGFGYIKNYLKKFGEEECLPLDAIPQTAGIIDTAFAGYKEENGKQVTKGTFNMAIPVKIFNSQKFNHRGKSIFDSKISSLDAFDEVVSQWMDAIRMGRANCYIPENLIPKNPKNGKILKPNSFTNRFIEVRGSMAEKERTGISVTQPTIPTENYLQSYITYLDLSLQGIISPSTLGIDTKKLDNAEAQREKEKTTLSTRGIIVNAIQDFIPVIVNTALRTQDTMKELKVDYDDAKVNVQFGEYANPSFEAVVETMSKARPGQPVMSIDSVVEELYGNSKDDDWKEKEVKRLKEEIGIVEVEEPKMNKTTIMEEDDEENKLVN